METHDETKSWRAAWRQVAIVLFLGYFLLLILAAVADHKEWIKVGPGRKAPNWLKKHP